MGAMWDLPQNDNPPPPPHPPKPKKKITSAPGPKPKPKLVIDRSQISCKKMNEHKVRCFFTLDDKQYASIERSANFVPSENGDWMYAGIALSVIVLIVLICGFVCIWKRMKKGGSHHYGSHRFSQGHSKSQRSSCKFGKSKKNHKSSKSKHSSHKSHSKKLSKQVHSKSKKSHKSKSSRKK